jgi:prepilin-type N-terminal cleavage/methylation domain-containing protein
MEDRGYSLLELLFVVSLSATLSGIALPQMLAALDDYRTAGAVRYMAGRIQRARMEAVGRSTHVAIRFSPSGSSYAYTTYADGNGDGVRTQDIAAGVDSALAATERLADNFRGVDFAVLPDLPPAEAGSAPPGTDPIKLGASNLLSYSPTGTSSSGSVYIKGHGKSQYVIRILGDTGRTRILWFDPRSRQWRPR